MKLLTLCAPTYNRCGDVDRFIESTTRLEGPVREWEVLIVDDASTDGTDRMIASKHPWVRVARLETNSGPAAARNLAFAVCETPYIAFFDSDVILHPDWHQRALACLDEDTIVSGKVLRPDGSTEWGSRRSTFLGGSVPTDTARADVGSSNNLVVPMKVARATGGFREDLRIYFEDSEFCIRARTRHGFRVRFAPELVVTHHHRSRNTPDRERRFWRNKVVGMMDLHEGIFRKAAFLALSLVLLLQHAGRPAVLAASLGGYLSGVREALRR